MRRRGCRARGRASGGDGGWLCGWICRLGVAVSALALVWLICERTQYDAAIPYNESSEGEAEDYVGENNR